MINLHMYLSEILNGLIVPRYLSVQLRVHVRVNRTSLFFADPKRTLRTVLVCIMRLHVHIAATLGTTHKISVKSKTLRVRVNYKVICLQHDI